MNKQLNGQFTKSFRNKIDHLNAFIKPAFEDSAIKSQIVEHNRSWARAITTSVRDHYQKRINEIQTEIKKLEIPSQIRRTVIDKAVYRAKTNFGNKLARETLGEFNSITNVTPSPIKGQIKTNTQEIQYVRGYTETLSNFHKAPFSYRGYIYQTVEHALQHNKAMFFEDCELADRVLNTQKPYQAKFYTNVWPNNYDWQKNSILIMQEILAAKFEQVMNFRESLLKCAGKKIILNIHDPFWGSGKTGSGTNHYGKCLKSVLMDKTSDKLTEGNRVQKTYTQALLTVPSTPNTVTYPKKSLSNNEGTRSGKKTANSSLPETPIRRSQRLLNRIDESQNAGTPTKTPLTPMLRQGSDTAQLQGSMTTHKRTQNKNDDWVLPKITKPILILGDSNLSRVGNTPPNIQIESFPGARLVHIKNLVVNHPDNESHPKTVLLSVGINNRQDTSTDIIKQSTEMLEAVKAKFPKSEIAYGELNYSKSLPRRCQETIQALNKHIRSFPAITKLPPMDGRKFHVNDDMIHWAPKTADTLVNWWLHNLNF